MNQPIRDPPALVLNGALARMELLYPVRNKYPMELKVRVLYVMLLSQWKSTWRKTSILMRIGAFELGPRCVVFGGWWLTAIFSCKPQPAAVVASILTCMTSRPSPLLIPSPVLSPPTMTILENRNVPYSGHRTHTGTPSNARNHHYLLNFAVSLAAIIFGIAVIAVFALAVRWRKRTSQSYLLEPRIDARIPQSSVSVVSDGRSTISLKFPPPGLSPPENPRDRLPALPRTPPHAHYPAPQARAFRLCQSCISGPSNRPPCYCPTCPNGPGWDNPPAYRANPPSPEAMPSRLSTTLVGHEDASQPRPGSITDENTIRRNSQRTPPTLVASRNAHVRSVQDSPTPAGHARRGSAASSADEPESDTTSFSTANSSPTLSPSPASSEAVSPRLLCVDVDGPPSLRLSDVPGAPAPAHRWGTTAIAPSRSSLDFAMSNSLSNEIAAYIRITPPSQDHLNAPPDETTAPDFVLYPSGPISSPAAVEDRDPGADGSHTIKWFMDLDWFGRRDPPADYSEHVPATGRRSG